MQIRKVQRKNKNLVGYLHTYYSFKTWRRRVVPSKDTDNKYTPGGSASTANEAGDTADKIGTPESVYNTTSYSPDSSTEICSTSRTGLGYTRTASPSARADILGVEGDGMSLGSIVSTNTEERAQHYYYRLASAPKPKVIVSAGSKSTSSTIVSINEAVVTSGGKDKRVGNHT